MPAVSVVIPAYNAGAYIRDAIDSALAQTLTDIEILIVDDGSTDNTRVLVAEYDDPRIRYLYQDNKGVSGARNAGILHAGADLIGLLDADDVWKPEFLHVLCSALEHDPQAAGAYSGFQYMDASGRLLQKSFTHTEAPDRYAAALLGGNWITPSAVVLRRRRAIEIGLFDQGVAPLEDYDMWLRVGRGSYLAGSAEILCYYRLSAAQVSSDSTRMARALHKLTVKHFGADDCAPHTWCKEKRQAYYNLYGFSSNAFLGAGDAEASARYLANLVALDGDVVNNVSLWYTFACSYQQKGELGDVNRLDMAKSEGLVRRLIQYSSAPTSEDHLTPLQKRMAEATAHLALALIYYGRRELPAASRHLASGFGRAPWAMPRHHEFWDLLWRIPGFALYRMLHRGSRAR